MTEQPDVAPHTSCGSGSRRGGGAAQPIFCWGGRSQAALTIMQTSRNGNFDGPSRGKAQRSGSKMLRWAQNVARVCTSNTVSVLNGF